MANSPSDVAAATWDDIIVGTGMGGATLGLALARAGRKVLFVERGNDQLRGGALKGDFPERHRRAGGHGEHEALRAGGRYTGTIVDLSEPEKPNTFSPFIGSGTGGSTALYGMALERFAPSDFQPAANHSGNHTLPEAWPVSYNELSAYYQKAESLYGVRGGRDPLHSIQQEELASAPPLSAPNQELVEFFSQKGLHPYALPMACAYSAECRTCQSYLCAQSCKRDSATTCLQPALEQYGAALLADCEVERVEAGANSIKQLKCRVGGESITLTASRYILAAGALETPRLLLSSACEEWPEGLGNQADLVGRHLMRHYVDLYAIFTRTRPSPGALIKQIAFNDFYKSETGKLGSVQSFGYLPPAALLTADMQRELRRDAGAVVSALFGLARPAVSFFLSHLLARSVLLATTLEDLPFADNRVTLSPDNDSRLAIRYRPGAGESTRIELFRSLMGKQLKPYRYLLLKQAENNERLAHACGTCRFGERSDNSVCDANHRVHGIDNLYIADSSVFPSSGGINPSLTIAALSLRLADQLTSQ